MNSSFLHETLYGIGKEALVWAPMAIGLVTNNPTILTVTEVGYAAFHLHAAYNCESKVDKFTALSNVAVSLISPFTYHPALASQISASTRARILIGMGGNNVVRGVSEIASVTKNLACGVFAKICSEEKANETGGIVGNTLRLGLGIFRVYCGSNQIQNGLSELSIQSPEPEMHNSQESPKMDPQYARQEFKRNAKTKEKLSETPSKIDPKHAREEFRRSSSFKAQPKNTCFPKSGKPHPYDIAFYKHASNPIPTITDGRCEGTLYLRSEDTNYLHAKDSSYLRAEDSRPIGEFNSNVVDALIKDGRVWYRTVEKVRNICKEIDEIHALGGKVKRLILVGHSDKHEMELSQKGRLEREFPFSSFLGSSFRAQHNAGLDNHVLDRDVVFPKKGCLNYLEPEADIILVGCNLGKRALEGNLADVIARQAPGHKVLAPLITTTTKNFVVREKNGKPEFYFQDPLRIDVTYTAKVKKNK